MVPESLFQLPDKETVGHGFQPWICQYTRSMNLLCHETHINIIRGGILSTHFFDGTGWYNSPISLPQITMFPQNELPLSGLAETGH